MIFIGLSWLCSGLVGVGEGVIQAQRRRMLRTPDAIRSSIEEFAKIGVDEAFFCAMNADRRQVERLAQATR